MTENDFDSNLFVNFDTGQSKKSPKRIRVTGSRAKRKKERKRSKRLSLNDSQDSQKSGVEGLNEHSSDDKQPQTSEDSVSTNGELERNRSGNSDNNRRGVKRKRADSSSQSPAVKSRKGDQSRVVSSLFKSNPEIPKLSKSGTKVDSIKEEVFASETFQDLQLHPFMVQTLEEKMKLSRLTAVQKLAIPILLQGHDAMVKSQTGSGKTLAFAIPIIQCLQDISPPIARLDGAYAIVILPTRELAQQCFKVFAQLLRPFIRIVPGCIMGGEKRKAEKASIRKGINIVVCTPGRLVDHLQNTASLGLDRVRFLVLDEADRLCDLGYEKNIAEIVTTLNSRSQCKRQTILLSATLSAGVERLAGISMDDPKHIFLSDDHSSEAGASAGNDVRSFSVPTNLKQFFVITPCKLRLVTLAGFILWKCQLSPSHNKMVVFMSTQDSVEFHYQLFNEVFSSIGETTLSVLRLHGDMEQKDRVKVFQTFAGSKHGLLLCTDVAARGLDLANVHWIVQFSSPSDEADYIHRIGRTARAGARGQSLLFLMPSEVEYVKVLNKHQVSLEEMQMNKILHCLVPIVADMNIDPEDGKDTRPRPRDLAESATYMQMKFESVVQGKEELLNIARRGYQSYVRSYATYPRHLKSVFNVQDLHLGHVAKTFGLREAPAGMGLRVTVPEKKTHKSRVRKKRVEVSEFGHGMSKSSKSSKPKPPGKKKKNKNKQK